MRLRPLAAALTFSTLLVGFAASAAHADDATAKDKSRAEFRRGVALVKQNDYRGARIAFAEAYRLYPHPSILLNLGITEEKNGEYVEAEATLTKYLADYGDASPDDVASAQAAMREVHSHVGVIRITVQTSGARAFIDDQPQPIVIGQATDLKATIGDHVLRVEADGDAPFRKNVHLNATDPDVETVTLVPWTAGQPVPTVTNAGAAPTSTTPADADSDASSSRHTVGWVLVGVGVAAAGFGAFSGIKALSLASTYNGTGPDSRQPQDKTNGTTFRTLADISFLAALGCGGVGAYFLLSKPESAASPSNGASSSGSTALGIVPGGVTMVRTF